MAASAAVRVGLTSPAAKSEREEVEFDVMKLRVATDAVGCRHVVPVVHVLSRHCDAVGIARGCRIAWTSEGERKIRPEIAAGRRGDNRRLLVVVNPPVGSHQSKSAASEISSHRPLHATGCSHASIGCGEQGVRWHIAVARQSDRGVVDAREDQSPGSENPRVRRDNRWSARRRWLAIRVGRATQPVGRAEQRGVGSMNRAIARRTGRTPVCGAAQTHLRGISLSGIGWYGARLYHFALELRSWWVLRSWRKLVRERLPERIGLGGSIRHGQLPGSRHRRSRRKGNVRVRIARTTPDGASLLSVGNHRILRLVRYRRSHRCTRGLYRSALPRESGPRESGPRERG